MRMIDADALSRVVKLAWDTSDSEDFEKSVFIAIATAPTIEERKNGKWIPSVDRWGDIVTTVEGYTCSECGSFNTDKDNFCPNCGADMRGEGDETD